jgi:L-asparagine transporter-like permease
MVLGATVTGLPALIIILVIVALLVIGFLVVVKGVGRGVSKAARSVDRHNDRR